MSNVVALDTCSVTLAAAAAGRGVTWREPSRAARGISPYLQQMKWIKHRKDDSWWKKQILGVVPFDGCNFCALCTRLNQWFWCCRVAHRWFGVQPGLLMFVDAALLSLHWRQPLLGILWCIFVYIYIYMQTYADHIFLYTHVFFTIAMMCPILQLFTFSFSDLMAPLKECRSHW